jgi:chaperone required for assembly of F1-ATPase
MRAALDAMDPWELTALHEFVTLSGSLVLGLEAMEEGADPEPLWALSRLDEDWQAEIWGHDEEAAEAAAAKQAAFLQGHRLLKLLREG